MDTKMIVSYLKKICSIPRESGDENAVSDYLVEFAKENGLEVHQDTHFNLLIKKPATMKTPCDPVILQGHLDMVYVKDPQSTCVYEEGIEVLEDERFLFASGTSLGADNGIAIAYCMALMASTDVLHPDLEFIFTVQEEVGLVGVKMMDLSSLKGTRLINIDSEEEGVFCTSCAGGVRCQIRWDITEETLEEERVPLKGTFDLLRGGHSGININMGLGNSIQLMGRVLFALRKFDVRIGQLDMPGKGNAIANRGSVCFYVHRKDVESVKEKIKAMERIFAEELQFTDEVAIVIEEMTAKKEYKVYSETLQKRIVNTLILMPNGVEGYSFAVEGLVESSVNMGALTEQNGQIELLSFIRSSVESQKQRLREKVQLIAETHGGECVYTNDYPGWQYRKQSDIRDTALVVYERMFQKKAEIEAIHAGLECGYLQEKMPGIDIISMGPNLFDVHSPKERLEKQSMMNTWNYLLELLQELGKK